MDGKLPKPEPLKPLNLLIQSIEDAYKSTSECFEALVNERKISFDLPWLLFKPNELVYSSYPGAHKPMCVTYDISEEKTTNQGVE